MFNTNFGATWFWFFTSFHSKTFVLKIIDDHHVSRTIYKRKITRKTKIMDQKWKAKLVS